MLCKSSVAGVGSSKIEGLAPDVSRALGTVIALQAAPFDVRVGIRKLVRELARRGCAAECRTGGRERSRPTSRAVSAVQPCTREVEILCRTRHTYGGGVGKVFGGTREYQEWRTEVGILKWVVMSTDQSELDTVCVRARVCCVCDRR